MGKQGQKAPAPWPTFDGVRTLGRAERRKVERQLARRTRPGFLEQLDRAQRARQQIDAAPGGALGWLTRFAAEAPARWLPGESEAHGYRLVAVAHPETRSGALAGADAGTYDLALKAQAVAALHSEIKAFLAAAVTAPMRAKLPLPNEGAEACLMRLTPPGRKPAIFRTILFKAPLRTLLFHQIAELVSATDRLIACPGPDCGRAFLALRKMKFCSPKCAERWHNGRKVEARRAL